MGGCPQCNAPVGDTDFACRQCGKSFVQDVSTLNAAAYDQPSGYTSNGSGGLNPPTFFVPPTTQETCPQATSALYLAVGGLFCLGFFFGSSAILTALKAREVMRANPRLRGAERATIALWLGLFDVVAWGYWVVTLAGRHYRR